MIGAPPPGTLPPSTTDPSGSSIWQAGDLLGFKGEEGDQRNLPNAGTPGGPLGSWMREQGMDSVMHGYDFMGVPVMRPWIMPQQSPPANEAMNQRGGVQNVAYIQPVSGGNIAQVAQQVRPSAQQPTSGAEKPGPAAEIPFGPVKGVLTLLPQFGTGNQTRPFGPGESIALPNGMTANEMTWTVPIGKRWAVVPGLWLINGVPTHLNEDQAAEMAVRSGLEWPFTFDTEKEANTYAEHREDFWQKTQDTTQQPPLWQHRSDK